jgi:4'-phosphopantetheinyl transferase
MIYGNIITNKNVKEETLALFSNIHIIRVILDERFNITPYMHWFDLKNQKKIISYYHYPDKLIAFASSLLQKLYLPYFLGCSQKELVIDYTIHHKPCISHPENIARDFNFNITHCYKYVVLAIYKGNDYTIGVDIELIDETIQIDKLSPIIFSKTECDLINNSAANFFKLWTKKESLIKALGTGFATDFYQETQLNLEDFETTDDFHIFTTQIDNYFLSICLYKAGKY